MFVHQNKSVAHHLSLGRNTWNMLLKVLNLNIDIPGPSQMSLTSCTICTIWITLVILSFLPKLSQVLHLQSSLCTPPTRIDSWKEKCCLYMYWSYFLSVFLNTPHNGKNYQIKATIWMAACSIARSWRVWIPFPILVVLCFLKLIGSVIKFKSWF